MSAESARAPVAFAAQIVEVEHKRRQDLWVTMHKEEAKLAKRLAEEQLRDNAERVERVAVMDGVTKHCRFQATREIMDKEAKEREAVAALVPLRQSKAWMLMWKLLKISAALVLLGVHPQAPDVLLTDTPDELLSSLVLVHLPITGDVAAEDDDRREEAGGAEST